MAITFVAAAAGVGTNGSAPAPTLPAGLVDGDTMVCMFYSRDSADGTVAISAGWEPVVNNRTTGGLLGVWWRTYVTGDTAPTLTLTGHTTGNSGETALARIAAWRGCDATAPIGTVGVVSTNAAQLNIGPISGISLGAGKALVVLGGKLDDFTSIAALSGDGLTWGDIGAWEATQGADASAAWNYAVNDTGSTVTVTAKTFTVSGGTSVAGKGVMFSLNEAAAVLSAMAFSAQVVC